MNSSKLSNSIASQSNMNIYASNYNKRTRRGYHLLAKDGAKDGAVVTEVFIGLFDHSGFLGDWAFQGSPQEILKNARYEITDKDYLITSRILDSLLYWFISGMRLDNDDRPPIPFNWWELPSSYHEDEEEELDDDDEECDSDLRWGRSKLWYVTLEQRAMHTHM
jgi:hypothetical protein